MNRFIAIFIITCGIFSSMPAFSQEEAGEAEEIVSIREERKRTLKYGIDSEIEPLLQTITEEETGEYVEEAVDLLSSTLNNDIKRACFSYLQTLENDSAVPAAEEILTNFEDRPLPLIKSAMEYLVELKEQAEPDLVFPLIEADSDIALSAIRSFSEIKVEGLTALLKEKYEERGIGVNMKAEILLALGKLKNPDTRELLESIAADEGEESILRNYACSALGELGNPGSIDVLMQVYASDDALTRSYALYGISKIDDERSQEIVIGALRDSYWKIRVYACEGLGERKVSAAVPALQYKAERDPEIQVRRAAVEALILIGGGDALDTVYRIFKNERSNTSLRLAAFENLMEHRFPAALPVIKEVFQKELSKENSAILDQMCKKFSLTESPQMTEFYKSMLDHGSLTVKIHALRGIALNSVGQLREEVEKLSAEEMPSAIRKHALRTLESF